MAPAMTSAFSSPTISVRFKFSPSLTSTAMWSPHCGLSTSQSNTTLPGPGFRKLMFLLRLFRSSGKRGDMNRRSTFRHRGFSLLEMMIAMSLGMIVLGAAVQLYSKAMGATWIVSQRAEMQQDFRSAANILTKDINMAGSGLGNNVQIALPSGPGTQLPVYGCDQIPRCYINGGAVAYPTQLVGGVNVPYLYGLIPGWRFGPTIRAAAGPTDVITVANADTNFLLNCYNATVSSNTVVRFTLTNPLPVTCIVPPPLPAPQAIDDPVVGLTPGDLVLFDLTVIVGAGATS